MLDAVELVLTDCTDAICPADVCPDGFGRRQIGDNCCACPERKPGDPFARAAIPILDKGNHTAASAPGDAPPFVILSNASLHGLGNASFGNASFGNASFVIVFDF